MLFKIPSNKKTEPIKVLFLILHEKKLILFQKFLKLNPQKTSLQKLKRGLYKFKNRKLNF